MKVKVFLLIIVVTLFFSNIFGQSCGGGTTFFHLFDEDGISEITNYSITLHIVDEDQSWKLDNFEKLGWKRQILDDKTAVKYADKKFDRGSLETAYEISANEYWRLLKIRDELLKKKPESFVGKKINRCNYHEPSLIDRDKQFSVCTSEACNLKVVAKIEAEGYETAYYVSDFICGCGKHYEFRLLRKRNKCLPNFTTKQKIDFNIR